MRTEEERLSLNRGNHPHYEFRDEIDYDGLRWGPKFKARWGNVDQLAVERNKRKAELAPLFIGLNQAFRAAETEAKTGVFALLMWGMGDVSEHDTKRLLYWGKVRF